MKGSNTTSPRLQLATLRHSRLRMIAGKGLAGYGVRGGPVTYLALTIAYLCMVGLGSATFVSTLELVAILAIFATGTNLLVGQSGLLSFGQAAFYGAGAYTLAILATRGLTLWSAFVVAIVLPSLGAAIVGLVLLRTRKLYFALASLAVSQLAYTAAVTAYGLTGGNNGMFGLPLPNWLATGRSQAWFVAGIAILVIGLMLLLGRSDFGLTLRAVRENRYRVKTLGLRPLAYELAAFTLAGAVCAVAGCLAVVHDGGATPNMLSWTEGAIPVLAAVIGGMYSDAGPIVGAAIYEFLYTTAVNGSQDWELIFGSLLVVIVLFAPAGLTDLFWQLPRGLARRLGARGKEEPVKGSWLEDREGAGEVVP